MEKPFGVPCVTPVIAQPRNELVVLLNESFRLNYMTFGFGYVFEEKIAVHVADIGDQLRLRVPKFWHPKGSHCRARLRCPLWATTGLTHCSKLHQHFR
jgi:hypothetical protein